jgi:hypothetical protein
LTNQVSIEYAAVQVLFVIVIYNPRWHEEMTTYSKGRVNTMSKNNQNHFKKNLIVILTLIFVLGNTNATVYGVEFSDYFPLDPASHGFKTFEWTYGDTGTYSSYISGTLTVPYTSGAIEGTGIVNFSDIGTIYATNDGSEVKWLGSDDFYFSTDQSLTAHPPVWTFSTVTDDMPLDQGTFYNYYPSSDSYEQDDNQSLLFDIQNVTVLSGSYNDAVIIWYLDEKFDFVGLNFDGKESDLGITLPDEIQTAYYSVTAFDVYAYGIGSIASGDIAAESGVLLNLAELADISLPDLQGEFRRLRFRSPLSSGDRVRTQINVTNIGNTATAFKQVIDIEILLRPCDVGDDIYITTMYDKSVSNLASGRSKKYNVSLNLPEVPEGGEYQLVARIDSSDDMVELNETNNEALSECFAVIVE